jgi:hypothetical protein
MNCFVAQPMEVLILQHVDEDVLYVYPGGEERVGDKAVLVM